MTPELKQLHRRVQREFFKSRQSAKWRKLKKSFKKLKKKSVRSFHTKFVNEMKISDPGKWYRLAKKIGAVGQNNDGDIKVESLIEMTNEQAVEEIASHFSSIANEYNPLDTCQLPAYQPTLPPPKVNELAVYKRIEKLKNTRSTLPLDLPNKLRKEFAVELAEPLTNIINESLIQQKYPTLWKFEWVTPVPKITHPKVIKDLRKISSTSDFSKVYESFLKDWIMEDISQKIDIGQFGGQKGLGTEHLIVCLVDRILKLLDDNQEMSAVIAALVDWSAAFDRQDPTLAIKNFLNIGVRPSLIPVLVSYLKDRKMKVKFNGEESKEHSLNGGGPQGTLLGGIEYLINSNNNANSVEPEDRFKYVDDLSILHLIMMSGLLMNYDFRSHVASDIEVDQPFLPPATYGTQTSLDKIADWTEANMMKFNHDKSNYIVFSRSHDKFSTRLNLENVHLDRVKMTKVLGVWLTEDLKWAKNTKEICIKAYSRVSMLTKLKYVGTKIEDLLDVYVLYIRSLTEYCSVVFHSRLTKEDINNLERIQKCCLRVILGDNYTSYTVALEMTGLQTLHERREERCLNFALKALKHPLNSRLFPLNPDSSVETRNPETFVVNFAKTETYRLSSIPDNQRRLNLHFQT